MAGQPLPPFGSLGNVRRAGEVLRRAAAKRGEVPSNEEVREARAIEDKLRRIPTMDLSSMQDIGGCRAVLDTREQVQRVVERFCANSRRRNRQSDKIRDYAAWPRDSGYRAIHVHTRYHGRRIEVQLRTRDQDNWAKIVEDLTSKTGIDFKNGDGPDEVHDLLRELSEGLSRREPGQPLTEALKDVLTRLAMMSALGSMLTSRDHRTGEE